MGDCRCPSSQGPYHCPLCTCASARAQRSSVFSSPVNPTGPQGPPRDNVLNTPALPPKDPHVGLGYLGYTWGSAGPRQVSGWLRLRPHWAPMSRRLGAAHSRTAGTRPEFFSPEDLTPCSLSASPRTSKFGGAWGTTRILQPAGSSRSAGGARLKGRGGCRWNRGPEVEALWGPGGAGFRRPPAEAGVGGWEATGPLWSTGGADSHWARCTSPGTGTRSPRDRLEGEGMRHPPTPVPSAF